MNIVPAIGATCLGIVIGYLVRFFIRRFKPKEFVPRTLGTLVGIILGAAVVKFLEADNSVVWFYPIGLLIGFVAYTVLALLLGARPEDVAFVQPVEISKQPNDQEESAEDQVPETVDLTWLFEVRLSSLQGLFEELTEIRTPDGDELLGDDPRYSYSQFLNDARKPYMFQEILQSLRSATQRQGRIVIEMFSRSRPPPYDERKPTPLELENIYYDLGYLGDSLAKAAHYSNQCTFNPSFEQTARYIGLGFALKDYMLARRSS